MNIALPLTGGLAQARQWLARKFVRIWKFVARPNRSGIPRLRQAAGTLAASVGRQRVKNICNLHLRQRLEKGKTLAKPLERGKFKKLPLKGGSKAKMLCLLQ